MIPSTIPAPALRVIERVAKECEIEAAGMFADQLGPAEHVARQVAIQELDKLTIGNKRRYSVAQIGAWFGLSRQWTSTVRARAPGYEPRSNRTRVIA